MQPNARIQSVIDLLEQTYRDNAPSVPPTPVDVIVNTYMRQRRYIGSSDRRDITEQFYTIVRHYWTLQGYLTAAGFGVSRESQEKTRGKSSGGGNWGQLAHLHVCIYLLKYRHKTVEQLKSIFTGEQFLPRSLQRLEEMILLKVEKIPLDSLPEAAQLTVSEEALDRLKHMFPQTYAQEIMKQNEEAQLDLRVNTLKSSLPQVEKYLRQERIEYDVMPYSPWGLRLKKRIPLSTYPFFQEGWVEVQDEGSQLISLVVGAKPGMQVWDYCAGAGGKTLAIAATMENKGRIIATDALEWRLNKAPQRFRRAGVHTIECRSLDRDNQKWIKRQYGKFDRVLVDAPCSGSGTWRRNPELKWRLSKTDLLEIQQKQQEILEKASRLVKVGGHLIYATCSLYWEENQGQIETFLKNNGDYEVYPIELPGLLTLPDKYLHLSPAQQGTDGFFACVMVKKGSQDESAQDSQ